MKTYSDLKDKIIQCYEAAFMYYKTKDPFIDEILFNRVFAELKKFLEGKNILNVELWKDILYPSLRNEDKLLGNYRAKPLEILYFNYRIIQIFNDFILNGGYEKLYLPNTNSSIKLELVGLLSILKENGIEMADREDLQDCLYQFENQTLKLYPFLLTELNNLFSQLIGQSKVSEIIDCIKNNDFLNMFKIYPSNNIIFEHFTDSLKRKPELDIHSTNTTIEKGFRIKKKYKDQLNEIYNLIEKDYILKPSNEQGKKTIYNKIFSEHPHGEPIGQCLRIKDIRGFKWLMPYIIKNLNDLEVFSYPAKSDKEHWTVFNHCFLLNNKKYTINQREAFGKISKSAKSQELKSALDKIFNKMKTS